MSNLVERLHHSTFIYILSTQTAFVTMNRVFPGFLLLLAPFPLVGLLSILSSPEPSVSALVLRIMSALTVLGRVRERHRNYRCFIQQDSSSNMLTFRRRFSAAGVRRRGYSVRHGTYRHDARWRTADGKCLLLLFPALHLLLCVCSKCTNYLRSVALFTDVRNCHSCCSDRCSIDHPYMEHPSMLALAF